MSIFNIFRKNLKPYNDASTNLIYELLFGDNIQLYKNNTINPNIYPWDILFSETDNSTELVKILSNDYVESMVKILIYNKLLFYGQKINEKRLLGVIVEIGLDNGLDVLASFEDGTARYINQTGKIIVWETSDENSNKITEKLFENARNVISKIGPWGEPRRGSPEKGIARVTFLVSDGLYFGEGPINVLFNDQMVGVALSAAAELMAYLIEKSS